MLVERFAELGHHLLVPDGRTRLVVDDPVVKVWVAKSLDDGDHHRARHNLAHHDPHCCALAFLFRKDQRYHYSEQVGQPSLLGRARVGTGHVYRRVKLAPAGLGRVPLGEEQVQLGRLSQGNLEILAAEGEFGGAEGREMVGDERQEAVNQDGGPVDRAGAGGDCYQGRLDRRVDRGREGG